MPIEPGVLQLIDELDDLRRERDDHWQIPRVEGDVLYQLAVATNARLVVEVGTSYGFSGLFWGAALKRAGGTLHTIDVNEKKYDSARATFARAGLGQTVVNHLGEALAILPKIEGPFDIVFLDSDRKLARRFFELVWPKVRPGGSVLVDNAVTHRHELAAYVAHVRSLPDAASTEIPVGNGLEWTVRVA